MQEVEFGADAIAGNAGTDRLKNLQPGHRILGLHREIFPKSYQIKPTSDCIYHSPIDLAPNGLPYAVPNQSVHDKYNLITAMQEPTT